MDNEVLSSCIKLHIAQASVSQTLSTSSQQVKRAIFQLELQQTAFQSAENSRAMQCNWKYWSL